MKTSPTQIAVFKETTVAERMERMNFEVFKEEFYNI